MSTSLYWQLCLQGFFFWLAYDLSRFPVIPLYAQKLGLSSEAIGLVVAASTLTGIFVKWLAGGLSDSLGRRILMLVACGVATLLPPLYFLADDARILIALRLVHGLGTAIMAPVGRAFASDLIPAERRGNLLSTYTASGNVGSMAARSLGGFLLFWGGFLFPFAASAAAGLVALLMVIRWPRDQRHAFQIQPVLRRMGQGFREVVSNRIVLLTSWVEAVQFFAMGLIDAFLPIYAKGEVGLTDWQIGLLYGIQMGTMILTKPLMGWASDKIGRRPQIVGGLWVGAVAIFFIPWQSGFSTLLWLVVGFGLATAFVTSATSALVTDVCEQRHYGAAHGVFGTILDAGHATGPLAAGLLIGYFSFRPTFTVYAGLLILASLFFWFLVRPFSRDT